MPKIKLYFNHHGKPVSFTVPDEEQEKKFIEDYEALGLQVISKEEYQEMRRAQKEGSRRRRRKEG